MHGDNISIGVVGVAENLVRFREWQSSWGADLIFSGSNTAYLPVETGR